MFPPGACPLGHPIANVSYYFVTSNISARKSPRLVSECRAAFKRSTAQRRSSLLPEAVVPAPRFGRVWELRRSPLGPCSLKGIGPRWRGNGFTCVICRFQGYANRVFLKNKNPVNPQPSEWLRIYRILFVFQECPNRIISTGAISLQPVLLLLFARASCLLRVSLGFGVQACHCLLLLANS